MKILRSIKLVLFFVSFVSFSQNQGVGFRYEVLDPNHAGKIFKNLQLESEKPSGSPYLQSKFTLVKVESVKEPTLMRYNVYKDEFEFITSKNDTLILDKIDDFSNIKFTVSNVKYKLLNYTKIKKGSYKGYLIDIYQKGNFGIYKKENILLTEPKIAKTTLETSMPAKYYKSRDVYYFKNNNLEIAEFPNSRKNLLKLFPDKKEVIENFIKENKIDFDIEKDMIKVVNFLASS